MTGAKILLAYGLWVAAVLLGMIFVFWVGEIRQINAERRERQRQRADRHG